MPYMYALYVCLICTHLRLFAVSSGVLLVGGVAERDPEVHRIFCVQPHKVRRAPNTCTAHTPQRLAATNSHHVRKAHSDGRARERRGSLSHTHTHTHTHTHSETFSAAAAAARQMSSARWAVRSFSKLRYATRVSVENDMVLPPRGSSSRFCKCSCVHRLAQLVTYSRRTHSIVREPIL